MNQESMTDEEIKEAIEHRDVLLDLRSVLATDPGKRVFRYLFKHLGVGELPDLGFAGDLLMDKLGFLRAGNAIFKLVAEADVETAATLIAKNEKERHVKLYAQTQER